MLFFIILAVISLLAIMGLVLSQWWRLRRGLVTSAGELSTGQVLWLTVDYFSVYFPRWMKQLGRLGFFHVLVYGRSFLAICRYLLFRTEKKFSSLIELVKGRGNGRDNSEFLHGKRGAASFFLEEIKQHVHNSKSQ